MARFNPKHASFEARVRTSFARQTAMATLGIEIADIKAGEIELRMPYSAAYAQQHGFVHAGIITTALDTACGYAAFSLAGRCGGSHHRIQDQSRRPRARRSFSF
jgi:acyl-coenzyme A thioesterase PaaI-like protein